MSECSYHGAVSSHVFPSMFIHLFAGYLNEGSVDEVNKVKRSLQLAKQELMDVKNELASTQGHLQQTKEEVKPDGLDLKQNPLAQVLVYQRSARMNE